MKISSRGQALLTFLSQFTEPFDLKDALNCPVDFEMGHPATWNDSTDKWQIFRELFHAELIDLAKTDEVVANEFTGAKSSSGFSQQYFYRVTSKGREALVQKPFASKIFTWFAQLIPSVYQSKEHTLARIPANQDYYVK